MYSLLLQISLRSNYCSMHPYFMTFLLANRTNANWNTYIIYIIICMRNFPFMMEVLLGHCPTHYHFSFSVRLILNSFRKSLYNILLFHTKLILKQEVYLFVAHLMYYYMISQIIWHKCHTRKHIKPHLYIKPPIKFTYALNYSLSQRFNSSCYRQKAQKSAINKNHHQIAIKQAM